MSRIVKALKNIDPYIWKKLPEEAQLVLRENGFISVPMKTVSISELYGDGDSLNGFVEGKDGEVLSWKEMIKNAISDGSISVDPVPDLYGDEEINK